MKMPYSKKPGSPAGCSELFLFLRLPEQAQRLQNKKALMLRIRAIIKKKRITPASPS
jgi:hypothetical protein